MLLDEAMLDITAGETSSRVTAWIYCKTIQTCNQVYDVRRAREWTAALNAWCDARPQFTGAYSGTCRIHRSELLALSGAWPEAAQEASLACRQLTGGYGLIITGGAFYQLGEIHRLRGEYADVERAYRQAGEHGWKLQPGIALLRLAQGDVGAATAAIRRGLAEATDRPIYRVPGRELTRLQLLPAYVEIMVAGTDLIAATAGADELAAIAGQHEAPALHARSALARGVVRLAEGRPDEAPAGAAPGPPAVVRPGRALRRRPRPGPHRPGLPVDAGRRRRRAGVGRGPPGLPAARRASRRRPAGRGARRSPGQHPRGVEPARGRGARV